LQEKFTQTLSSSSPFFDTLSLIRRTDCARAQFSGCSSTTNTHSETGQMAVCCQNLTLGALTSPSALSVQVGALFKKFGLFLNTPRIVHSKGRNGKGYRPQMGKVKNEWGGWTEGNRSCLC
jgi:hypothetical protein